MYGPTVRRFREDFWGELGASGGFGVTLSVLMGTLTLVRFPREKSRGSQSRVDMRRFSKVIDDLEMKDLPLQGGSFTWRGWLNNQSQSGLDRFLVSEVWITYFSGVVQSILLRPVSDHFPILLDGGDLRSGPSSFRFEIMWLKVEGFKDLLQSWWSGFSFSCSYSYILTKELKALKAKLKVWNKEIVGPQQRSLAMSRLVRRGL